MVRILWISEVFVGWLVFFFMLICYKCDLVRIIWGKNSFVYSIEMNILFYDDF